MAASYWRVTSLLLLCCFTCFVQNPVASKCFGENSTPRNVLVIMADDLGWGDVGFHGGAAQTINLDQLAREGVELTRFYGYHLCSPARAALLSGMMPKRFGITTALRARDPGLPADLPTLPRVLQTAGYQTWMVGKWHVGTSSPPLKSGFDHFYGFDGPEIDYWKHTSLRGDPDWQRNGKQVTDTGYSTSLFAEEAIRLLRDRDPNRPFYLQLAFNAPHFPLSAPEQYIEKYSDLPPQEALRLAVLHAMDESIGWVLNEIDKQQLRNDTLVVFLSDNGADARGNNQPFRGRKDTVFEGGIHLPCVMRLPEVLKAGTKSTQLISTQDLFPTIVSALEKNLDTSGSLDGIDLWSSIQSGDLKTRDAMLIAGRDTAIFQDQWKLIKTSQSVTFLFDILNDPSESSNVIDQNPTVAQSLLTKLEDASKEFPAMDNRRPNPPRR